MFFGLKRAHELIPSSHCGDECWYSVAMGKLTQCLHISSRLGEMKGIESSSASACERTLPFCDANDTHNEASGESKPKWIN